MEANDYKALAAFGRLGIDLAASRILSYCALVGVVALAGAVAYNPTWEGAAVDLIVALCFWVAVRAESQRAPKRRQRPRSCCRRPARTTWTCCRLRIR